MEKLIERILSDDLMIDDVIAQAATNNKPFLEDMNDTEIQYFKIGFDEGIRMAAEILQEIAAIKEK